ncbi:MAG: PAS domain S-box protein [wastewater metagenome]|nr:PAS domain S-box protein [Candidatus Loosdrechtia aerotolerans]
MGRISESLSKKALLGIISILLPILITFLLNYNQSKIHLEKHITNDVASTAGFYEEYVYRFLETAKIRTRDFANDSFVRTHLYRKIRGKPSPHDILSKYLIKNKLTLYRDIKTIRILSLDGCVVASTNASETGMDLSREAFFMKGKEAVSVVEHITGDHGLSELAISAPIFRRDTSKPIGVIVNFIQISKLNDIVSGGYSAEPGGFNRKRAEWKTMETYLVNRNKKMIAGSLFLKEKDMDVVMEQIIDTLPINEGLTLQKEVRGFYRNHRGTRVVSASAYIPLLKWIVVVEVDEDEVFAPIRYIFVHASILAALVIGIVICLFVGFLKKVVKPLRIISDTARCIADGTFDVPIPVQSGDEIGVLCKSFNTMACDIKARTDALKKSETSLAKAQRIAHLGNWEWDIIQDKVYLSDEAFRVIGLVAQNDTITFDTFISHIHPGDMKRVKKSISEALDKRKSCNIEFRLALNGNGERLIHVITEIVPDEAGRAVQMIGTIQDVTEYKRMEEEIRLLQAMTMAISEAEDFHSVLSIVLRKVCKYTNWAYGEAWLISHNGEYLEYGIAWHQDPGELERLKKRNTVLTFLQGAGLPGRVWLSKKPEWILESVVNKNFPHAQFLKQFGFKAAMGVPIVSHDEIIAVLTFFVKEQRNEDERMIRLVSSIAAQLSALIQRKRVEDALQKSEEKYRLLVEHIPDVVWTADQVANITFIDPKVEKVYGYAREEIYRTGNSLWLGRIHPDDIKKVKEAYALLFKSNKVFDVQYRIRKKDETWVWIHDRAMITYHKDGTVYTDGISSDITEYKRMEEQLLKLSCAIEQSPNIVIITDTNGNIEYANPKFTELTGYRVEEVIGKTPRFLKSGKTPHEEYKRLWDIVSSGGKWRGELLNEKKNGELYWVVMNISPIKNREGVVTHFIGVAEDVTHIKRAEEAETKLREQLYHAQKLESIGTLAGGIAHDFNNILAIMIGYGNLLRKELEKDNPLMMYAQKILASAERAVKLTRGLLTFSRKQQNNPKPVNLSEIIKRIESLLIRIIGEDIQLKTTFIAKDCIVMADSSQMEQVLMNLVTNARDAMPDGGVLTIGTKIVELDEEYIKAYGYGEIGKYILLSVSDTGIGMDEETKKRVFEPFFTTKEVGKGTGLGLSIVYGIVKQHGGYINVESRRGRGTTFKVYIPLTESEIKKTKREVHIAKGGKEIILLAEDEEEVRTLTRVILEKAGYTIIEAQDGADALNKFVQNKDVIQFLILDVIMPTKDGKSVYDTIRHMKPDIKSLFISGYSEEIVDKKEILKEGLHFISKPVSPDKLLKKVREILDKQDSRCANL